MPRKRCRIVVNEKRNISRPHCAIGVKLPCKSIKCKQTQGIGELTKMMLNNGFQVGRAEKKVLEQVAEHYFCSTALGRKSRDFGFFKIKEVTKGQFEISFKKNQYIIEFT